MKRITNKVLLTVVVMTVITKVSFGITIYPTKNGQLFSDGTVNTNITTATMDIGTGTTGKNVEFSFTLPELPEGQQFATAQFSVRVVLYNSPTFNCDLYGIEYRTNDTISADDYYRGTSDPSDKAFLIQSTYFYPTLSNGRRTSTNELVCADFLNDQYQKSLADRNAGETISIFVRINPTGSQGYKYYRVTPLEYSSNKYYWPYIIYTTEDIPPKGTVLIVN